MILEEEPVSIAQKIYRVFAGLFIAVLVVMLIFTFIPGDAEQSLLRTITGQDQMTAGAEVIFYPEHRLQGLRGKVIDVDSAEASRISEPMLTTRHGGAIPLAAQAQELIPAEPHFRVLIALESAPESLRETRGKVVIEGHWRSPLGDLLTALIAVLVRESGF